MNRKSPIATLLSFAFRPLIFRSITLCFLVLLNVSVIPVFALNFSGGWFYRQAGGDDQPTRDEFRQRYSLGVGPTLTLQPTHAITASAGVSYTRTERGDERDITADDRVTPVASLSLINDIFTAGLAGSTSFRDSEAGSSSSQNAWEASLGSNWKIPFFPSLRFSYAERTEAPENSAFFSNDGQKETDSIIAVNWDLELAQLSYTYANNASEDEGGTGSVESESHFARIETGGKFWDNRLAFTLSQQYSTAETKIDAGDADGGFDFVLPGSSYQAVTPEVLPPLVPGDTLDVLLENFVPFDLDINEQGYFVVQPEDPQQAALVRLTLEDFTNDAAVLGLQWDLYRLVSGVVDGQSLATWELVSENIPSEYDVDNNQIEIPIADFSQEFMLVAVNNTGVPFTFIQLDAISQLAAGEQLDTSTTNHRTNLGLRVKLTQSLQASGNLLWEQNESDSQAGQFENRRWNAGGRLNWRPTAFLSTNLGYNELREIPQTTAERISRNYSLTVTTTPLPQMTVAFGGTLSERFSDKQKNFLSNRYFLTARAPIYPDLTADWTLAYTENERRDLDEESVWLTNEIWTSALNLNARLYRNLFADLRTGYSHRTDSDGDRRENVDVEISARYRPSSLLSIRGSYKTFFGDLPSEDQWQLSAVLRVLQTYKTNLTLNTLYNRRGDDSSQNIAAVGNWNISRHLTLQGRGNYRIGDINSYNFSVNLNFSM